MIDIPQYLSAICTMRGPKPAELVYNGLEDFLVQEGYYFVDRSEDVKALQPKRCFNNAFQLFLTGDRLHYCEGYAGSFFPVHHAWCCDDRGIIHDPTWVGPLFEDKESTYYGVTFDDEYVMAQVIKNGRPGIFEGKGYMNVDLLKGQVKLLKI